MITMRSDGLASEKRIYIHGILKHNDVSSYSNGSINRIGSLSIEDNYFFGEMDELGIWNRPLIGNEINELYIQELIKLNFKCALAKLKIAPMAI